MKNFGRGPVTGEHLMMSQVSIARLKRAIPSDNRRDGASTICHPLLSRMPEVNEATTHAAGPRRAGNRRAP